MSKNIYRKKGSRVWYFRVSVGGRELRESLRTADRPLAEQRARKRLEELNRASWGDERRAWIAAVEAWADEAEASLRPQTIRRYGASLAAIGDLLEPLWLDEVTKPVLARIAARPGVTNATRRRDLTAVSVVLKAAEDRGWLESAPTYSRRSIRERRDPIVLPEAGEVARLCAMLSPMLARLVRTLELTGLRLEEAGGLVWQQVDRNRKVLQLTHTKTGRPRAVPLSDAALGTILGTPRHLACPFVFWHGQEAPRRYGDLSGYLYDLRKKVGVAWRIHDLRHLFAVRYLREGGSIYHLQQILGHTTIRTTEVYLDHLTPDEQVRAKGIA